MKRFRLLGDSSDENSIKIYPLWIDTFLLLVHELDHRKMGISLRRVGKT